MIRKENSVWILSVLLFKMMKPVNLQLGMPMYAPLMLPPPAPIFAQQSPMMIVDKKKPPCPPCLCKPACTPAFFSYCSPCHKMCRCRDGIDSVPIPLPPIGAPQVLPPRKKLPFVYSSEESTDSSSSSEYYRYRRHRKNRHRHRHSKYL